MLGTPTIVALPQMASETLLHTLTQNLGEDHWEGVGTGHPPLLASVKPSGLASMNNA